MTARSLDALPVLEEWYDGPVSGERPCNRPRACGVVGCAEPLVKTNHQKFHLCAAHIKCPAVLRRGVPQRWCGTCHKFHALQAFSGSRRYAPASCWERCAHPQTAYSLQRSSRVLHIARCSLRLNRALCCVQGAQFRMRAHTRFLPNAHQTPRQVLRGQPQGNLRARKAHPAGAPSQYSRGGAHRAQPRCAPSSRARSWSCARGSANDCTSPGHPGRHSGGPARARRRCCGRRAGAPC